MIREFFPRAGRLQSYFDNNPGRLIHKWDHYFGIYETHLARYRGRAPRILEIGVSHGGSLQMWRDYFGTSSRIVGIDVEPRVAALAEPGIAIEVGDQGDPNFIGDVARRHGPFDIIIDDGSHVSSHQITSFETLWQYLKFGGVYLVEDLHTNYWPEHHGGGVGVDGTFIEWTKHRIDDLNARHSRQPDFAESEWTRTIGGIHLYDSVAAFDKFEVAPLSVRMTGVPAFDTLHGKPAAESIDAAHRAQIDAVASPQQRLRRLVRSPLTTTRRVAGRWIRAVPPVFAARATRIGNRSTESSGSSPTPRR